MNDHQYGQYGRLADEDNQQWINRKLNMTAAGGGAGGAGRTGQRKAGDESHKCFGTDTLAPGGGGTGGGTEAMPADWDSRRSADANFFNAFGLSPGGPGGSPGLHGRRSGGTQSEYRHPFQSLQSPLQRQQLEQTSQLFLDSAQRSPSLQDLQAQGQYADSLRGRLQAQHERRREERRRQLQGPQEQMTEAASARPAQVSGKKRIRGGRKSSAYGGSACGGSACGGSVCGGSVYGGSVYGGSGYGLDEESMEQFRARADHRDQRSNQYHNENEYKFELDDGAGYETEAAPLVGRAFPLSVRKEQAASADDGSAHDSSSSSGGRDAFGNSDSEESEQSAYRTDDEEDDESEDGDDDIGAHLTPRANGTGADAGRNRRDRPAQMGAVANADTINRTVRALAAEQGVPRRGSEASRQSEEVQPKRRRASASGQGRRTVETTITAVNNTGSHRTIDLLIGAKVPGKKYYTHTCEHNNTTYLNVCDGDGGIIDPTNGWKPSLQSGKVNLKAGEWSNISRKNKNRRIDNHVKEQYALAGITLASEAASSPPPVAGSDSNAAAAAPASSGNGLALATVPGASAGANTGSGVNNGLLATLIAPGWQLVHHPSGPAGAGQHLVNPTIGASYRMQSGNVLPSGGHGIGFGPQSASMFGQVGVPATTGGGNLNCMLAAAGGGNLPGMPGVTGMNGMAGLGGAAGMMGGLAGTGVGLGGGAGVGGLFAVLQQQQQEQQLLQHLHGPGAAPAVAAGTGGGGGGPPLNAALLQLLQSGCNQNGAAAVNANGATGVAGPTAAGGGGTASDGGNNNLLQLQQLQGINPQLLAQFLAGGGFGGGAGNWNIAHLHL